MFHLSLLDVTRPRYCLRYSYRVDLVIDSKPLESFASVCNCSIYTEEFYIKGLFIPIYCDFVLEYEL